MIAKSLFAVLGAFLAMAVVVVLLALPRPAATHEPPPTPPPPPPTPTHYQLQTSYYCENLYISGAGSSVNGNTLRLFWNWDQFPQRDGTVHTISFRPERIAATAGADDGWETLEEATEATDWTIPFEPGRWRYRVAIVKLAADDDAYYCEPRWVEIFVGTAPAPPTPTPLAPVEVEEYLDSLCGNLHTYDVRVVVQDDNVAMTWQVTDYPGPHVGPRYGPYTVTYRVERIDDAAYGSGGQRPVEITGGTNWTGPADPGRWRYRVAVIRVSAYGYSLQCDPWWDEFHIEILSEQERTERKAQRQTLIGESVRCATATLTRRLSPAAREIVARYIEQRVGEIADQNHEDLGALVFTTIQLCTDPDYQSASEHALYWLQHHIDY